MREALFLPVAAGVLPATLLHVGSPAERLFDPPDVKEVQLDAPDGSSPRGLVTPRDYLKPPDVERHMELLEAELAPASTGRFPELEGALNDLQICIRSAVMRSAAETIAKAAPTDG